MKTLHTDTLREHIGELKAGEEVLLSGEIYTARDQAHKRLCDLLATGQELPLDIKGKVFYYCGPTATPAGKVIGSCGPTTSRRMDAFAPALLDRGLIGMIGKGARNVSVREAVARNKAVYFAAPSGCGALLAKHVVSQKVVAFADLGPEAIRKLVVKDLPLLVIIDPKGNDFYARFT
jgi:fumarate hydratase subunit beta